MDRGGDRFMAIAAAAEESGRGEHAIEPRSGGTTDREEWPRVLFPSIPVSLETAGFAVASPDGPSYEDASIRLEFDAAELFDLRRKAPASAPYDFNLL